MSGMRFVDTNILLYAVSKEPSEAKKNTVALALLDHDDLVLSVHVLQEFYVQSTRPTRPDPLTHTQASNLIESWLRFKVQDITADLLLAALSTRQQWKISYWDAAIIEAARAARCSEVLSEDLQHGMDFSGVNVRNPFL